MQEDEEIEQMRQRKIMEMHAKIQEQQRQVELRRQLDAQKRAILQEILTPEARGRLANIRAAKPQFAERIELQLIQLAQAGRITSQITDSQLREILNRLVSRKRETKITRV